MKPLEGVYELYQPNGNREIGRSPLLFKVMFMVQELWDYVRGLFWSKKLIRGHCYEDCCTPQSRSLIALRFIALASNPLQCNRMRFHTWYSFLDVAHLSQPRNGRMSEKKKYSQELRMSFIGFRKEPHRFIEPTSHEFYLVPKWATWGMYFRNS